MRKAEREGVNEGYEVMRGEGGREGEESEHRRILLLLLLLLLSPPPPFSSSLSMWLI